MGFFRNEKMFVYLPWSTICKFGVDDTGQKNYTSSSDLCGIYSAVLFSGILWSLQYLLLKFFIQNRILIWESKIAQVNLRN